MSLNNFSDQDLHEELARREQERRDRGIIPDSPTGWWEVSTDGDCEGKSTNNLGLHYGHIGDIALALAGAAMYSLYFKPAPDPRGRDNRRTTMGKSNICVMGIAHIKNNTISPQELSKLREFFGPEWEVQTGNYYQSVDIKKKV
ncbi:MAG: hypothetical protein WC551_08660 [Patescibacteria group bacterium]